MRLLRRGGRSAAPQGPADSPDGDLLLGLKGDLPCREPGCPSHEAIQCQYVDRRGRSCDTAWCSEHRAVVAGSVYCHRHAGTIAAVGSVEQLQGMPDIDNRAPSLVNWVSRDLDEFIAESLVAVLRPDERFVREPAVTTINDHSGVRRYERAWKLVDHTGVSLAVAIFVIGEDDVTVRVRVGNGIAAQGVPPWIERRRRGVEVPEETDRAQRAQYYDFLRTHILEAIRADRQRGPRFGQR